MKKFILALAVLFLISSNALALNDSEYKELMKDSSFADSEKELAEVWAEAKKLPAKFFEHLQKEQREWVSHGRDKRAESLMKADKTLSRAEAYAQETGSRVEAINSAIDAASLTPEKLSDGFFIFNDNGKYIELSITLEGGNLTVLDALKSNDDVTELTYSDHEPLGNMRTTFLNDIFFRAVEEESKGRVKIIPHWNGEISISYEALNTLKDGSKTQIAVIVPEYCAKELPLHQLFKSFPTGPAGQEQANFFRDIYSKIPALTNEIEAQGLHVIFVATGYPAAFFSAKPMTNLQGLKGQRWRSASFWHKDFLTNSGATPVTMPWGQGVFDALNDGTLDGLIVNIDSGYDIHAHKAAPNILTSQKLWLGHEYIIAVNKSAWEKLSDDDKKAIEKAAEVSYSKLGGIMDASFSHQLEILRADGANVRILNDDEINFWEQMTNYGAVQNKWVADKNFEAVDSVLDTLRHCMKNFIGDSAQKLTIE